MPHALPADSPSDETVAAPAVGSLLNALLFEQQESAVASFARWKELEPTALPGRYYRDLIPSRLPGVGQQFAFEVDLDACSGCKSCVVACNQLNGLEEGELWRSVGLLHGGSNALPVLQHVTTACHHCLEPPCLEGCPVLAYEKDELTGIVRHLDDQCIGCQYCILKCPYGVPRYSAAKGIVRKCDMCRGRLAEGEAPACVQACPTQAIRIAIVDKAEVAENAEANLFLPGAPEPGLTLPTTVYKTSRSLPRNLLPADYYSSKPQHAHWPLVLMLVLTQMSVGAFVVDQALQASEFTTEVAVSSGGRAWDSVAALLLGATGLAASVFHLGRPWLAYRAMIGWRTSWLSREVLAFGLFATLASVYALLPWMRTAETSLPTALDRGLGGLVAFSGLLAVGCSIMIYASTGRAFWSPASTGPKFLLTCLVAGIPVVLLLRLQSPGSAAEGGDIWMLPRHSRGLLIGLIASASVKLTFDAAILAWRDAKVLTPLRRTARLMTGDLRRVTWLRFSCGLLGGVVAPGCLLLAVSPEATPLTSPLLALLLVATLGNLTGELLERYLFFAAVVAPRMPGAPTA